MAKVYLLFGGDSESSAMLKVFAERADAQARRLACEAHQERRPKYPTVIEDTPENDKLHDDAHAKMERWRKRHPGGPAGWIYSYFSVGEERVVPGSRGSQG